MRVSVLSCLVAATLSLGGCATTPRVALRDAQLVEGPVLIRRAIDGESAAAMASG